MPARRKRRRSSRTPYRRGNRAKRTKTRGSRARYIKKKCYKTPTRKGWAVLGGKIRHMRRKGKIRGRVRRAGRRAIARRMN